MNELTGGLKTIDLQREDKDKQVGVLASETLKAVDNPGELCYSHSARIIKHFLELKKKGKEPVKADSYRIWYIKGHGVPLIITPEKLFFIDIVGCSTYNMFPGIYAFRKDDWDFTYGNAHYEQSISEDLVVGSKRLEYGRPMGNELPIRTFQNIFDIAQKDRMVSMVQAQPVQKLV